MQHWSAGYIGIPHDTLDCGQLVERVLREQFGREVSFPRRERDDLEHRSALIVSHAADYASPVPAPYDGCGVLMFARGRRAHIGMYCVIAGQAYVLHSDAMFGSSVCAPLARVTSVYRLEGYYAWL